MVKAVETGGAIRGWRPSLMVFATALMMLAWAGLGAAQAAALDSITCRSAKARAYDKVASLPARPRTIVAVGSSSTEGISKNDKARLYPAAMERALRQAWPGAEVKVYNRGRGGEIMRETRARFDRDVLALDPSLVIWQLGVNDALRFQGVDGLRDEVRAGLQVLAQRGIPVILLDLQYAPVVLRDPDSAVMQSIIADEAGRAGTRVFHFKRFELMKVLAEQVKVPVDAMIDQDGLHMSDAMHSCVGELLADMLTIQPSVTAASVQ